MTLLALTQAAADEIGLPRPNAVAGATDGNVMKLFRYANKIGNRLMKVVDWQALRKEQTFTAVSGEPQAGIIPADFDRFIPETFWDRSTTQLISGPITPVEWNQLKAFANYDPTRKKFIYRGGAVSIYPAMSGGESLAFEYVSSKWVLATDGTTYKTSFTADTDTSLIDEELITYGVVAEFLQSEGQPFQMAAAAFNDRFNLMIANDQPSAGVMTSGDIFGNGRHFSGTPAADFSGSYLLGSGL